MKKLSKKEEIEKLKSVLMEKIKSENDERYHNLSADEIMKILIDSSSKGKYVFWVLREFIKGNIQRFEDMERVKQTLILFKNNLQKFDSSQKQLNKISFQDLETLVSPYQDILTQNTVKRIQKEKIWADIETIYSGPEGSIYIPKTKEASVFLGQGTRWCTASVNNNMFDYYNEKGALYIFVLPEKDEEGREIKYQLHMETGQFMDIKDIRVTEDNQKLNKIKKVLFEKIEWEYLSEKSNVLNYIPLEKQNKKIIKNSFKRINASKTKIYPHHISKINPTLLDDEILSYLSEFSDLALETLVELAENHKMNDETYQCFVKNNFLLVGTDVFIKNAHRIKKETLIDISLNNPITSVVENDFWDNLAKIAELKGIKNEIYMNFWKNPKSHPIYFSFSKDFLTEKNLEELFYQKPYALIVSLDLGFLIEEKEVKKIYIEKAIQNTNNVNFFKEFFNHIMNFSKNKIGDFDVNSYREIFYSIDKISENPIIIEFLKDKISELNIEINDNLKNFMYSENSYTLNK